jgi:NADPH:quinone reductase-like Zn-dependent oxidoreductase
MAMFVRHGKPDVGSYQTDARLFGMNRHAKERKMKPPSEEEAKNHHVKASMLVTETSTGSLQKVTAMIDTGKIKPFVGKVYPLSEVAEAWRDAPSIEGKTVFTVSG